MKLTIAPINEKTFEKLISMLSGIKVMHPLLRPYLRKVMTAGYCKGNYKHPHHNQNEVVRTAYYIGTGYIIVYYEKDGDRHVIGICGSNEIVAGSSFMQGLPSRYSIKITRGSYVLMISKQNMEKAYTTVPETEEQARLTQASFEARELQRDELNRHSGEDRVLIFYGMHPGLLYGKFLTEEDIASYLNMSRINLYQIKCRLVEKELLPGK